MHILLISTYELGHQPFNLASPATHLLQAGHQVQGLDLAVQGFAAEKVRRANFIDISAAMHTALRLGIPTARRVRQINPAAHTNFYGLHAGLNVSYLLDTVPDSAIGGEYEQALVKLVNALTEDDNSVIAGVECSAARGGTHFPRQAFLVPARHLLPFTPWATRQDFPELIDFVEKHDLIAQIDPLQYSIRLLLPPQSSLLALPETLPYLHGFDEEKFTFIWKHPDPAMDQLQEAMATCLEAAANIGENIYETFAKIQELAYRICGWQIKPQREFSPSAKRYSNGSAPPRLTEDWFC